MPTCDSLRKETDPRLVSVLGVKVGLSALTRPEDRRVCYIRCDRGSGSNVGTFPDMPLCRSPTASCGAHVRKNRWEPKVSALRFTQCKEGITEGSGLLRADRIRGHRTLADIQKTGAVETVEKCGAQQDESLTRDCHQRFGALCDLAEKPARALRLRSRRSVVFWKRRGVTGYFVDALSVRLVVGRLLLLMCDNVRCLKHKL